MKHSPKDGHVTFSFSRTCHCAALIAATLCWIAPFPSAHAQDGAEPPPCPDIERLCGSIGPDDPPDEDQTCTCGPGEWQRVPAHAIRQPREPFDRTARVRQGQTTFSVNRTAAATSTGCFVQVSVSGESNWWSAGSNSLTLDASFADGWKEEWRGSLPACARSVQLAATGRGSLAVAASCSAHAGCSASTSASMSASASSRGNASAACDEKIGCAAAYSRISASTDISGNVGAAVHLESPSIEGSFSAASEWRTDGAGSATGTLSFTVKPDRTYCALTNLPLHTRWNGTAAVSAAAAVDEDGSVGSSASANLNFFIQ